MNELFQHCVDILRDIAQFVGCTYEEINIVIFIIVHPLITLYFIYKYREAFNEFIKLRTKYWKLKDIDNEK